MNTNIQRIEQNINNLLSTGFAEKHNVVVEVAKIPELEYGNFDDLKSDLISGKTTIRIAPFGQGIGKGMFEIWATKRHKLLFNSISVLTYFLPIAGILLGVFLSYWWLLLLLVPATTIPLGKKVYLSALFGAVGASEKAFCFAYCGNIITVERQDGTIRYRGMAAR